MGVHRDGAIALVGVKAQTWAAWRHWVQTSATVEPVRPWTDEGQQGERVRDLRPLGGPMFVLWTAPPAPPVRAWSVKGQRAMDEAAAAAVRKANRGEDRGGFLCWTAAPAGGRLPVLRRHQLGDGLEVLANSDVLPLAAVTPDGWRLAQSGSIREADPVRDCPAWLLAAFGAKWAAS